MWTALTFMLAAVFVNSRAFPGTAKRVIFENLNSMSRRDVFSRLTGAGSRNNSASIKVSISFPDATLSLTCPQIN